MFDWVPLLSQLSTSSNQKNLLSYFVLTPNFLLPTLSAFFPPSHQLHLSPSPSTDNVNSAIMIHVYFNNNILSNARNAQKKALICARCEAACNSAWRIIVATCGEEPDSARIVHPAHHSQSDHHKHFTLNFVMVDQLSLMRPVGVAHLYATRTGWRVQVYRELRDGAKKVPKGGEGKSDRKLEGNRVG
ncbi:hypothetical protein BV22DRAFT_1050830 [Leucogyrophana mollusca]|uniref:Uncharacterized protein n=1 Tax=Leucogyrophana mollusca TaxID=85980 RepID=A0ACB8B1S0_9AGAM|nr:hypothetical protein BV22DRAFT_1050830 [Leucogyrophana mollusca]